VNTIFSKTLATAMRLILKLALDWKLTISLISPSLSFFVRSFSSGEFSSAISAFQRGVSIAAGKTSIKDNVNNVFDTLATAMRLILKLALDWKLTISLISPSLSFFVRSFSVAILRFFSERLLSVTNQTLSGEFSSAISAFQREVSIAAGKTSIKDNVNNVFDTFKARAIRKISLKCSTNFTCIIISNCSIVGVTWNGANNINTIQKNTKGSGNIGV
jgi:hypothetical protein